MVVYYTGTNKQKIKEKSLGEMIKEGIKEEIRQIGTGVKNIMEQNGPEKCHIFSQLISTNLRTITPQIFTIPLLFETIMHTLQRN